MHTHSLLQLVRSGLHIYSLSTQKEFHLSVYPVIRIKGSAKAIETLFLNEKTMELIMFRSLFEHDEPTPINPPNHQEPALAEFL